MGASDCKPPGISTRTRSLQLLHNNRLGAVYEAVYSFVETRKYSRRSAQNGKMSVDNDTVFLVLFDDTATNAFENWSFVSSEELLLIMMNHQTSIGTNYAAGINMASEIIKRNYDPLK